MPDVLQEFTPIFFSCKDQRLHLQGWNSFLSGDLRNPAYEMLCKEALPKFSEKEKKYFLPEYNFVYSNKKFKTKMQSVIIKENKMLHIFWGSKSVRRDNNNLCFMGITCAYLIMGGSVPCGRQASTPSVSDAIMGCIVAFGRSAIKLYLVCSIIIYLPEEWQRTFQDFYQ